MVLGSSCSNSGSVSLEDDMAGRRNGGKDGRAVGDGRRPGGGAGYKGDARRLQEKRRRALEAREWADGARRRKRAAAIALAKPSTHGWMDGRMEEVSRKGFPKTGGAHMDKKVTWTDPFHPLPAGAAWTTSGVIGPPDGSPARFADSHAANSLRGAAWRWEVAPGAPVPAAAHSVQGGGLGSGGPRAGLQQGQPSGALHGHQWAVHSPQGPQAEAASGCAPVPSAKVPPQGSGPTQDWLTWPCALSSSC
ncbi:hypothetical protein PCL_09950 [Purpureocillium lilacinum]|uniref:Uncharacterized protein n=1 Tax=Purpureocillium lilacinum TaxID=33203 RepID=A0A2U3EEI9_PURLI|nr:hypothetical protein PCL_09950 [Purpureocillium lilacinum]